MKRIQILLICALSVFSLYGCGSSGSASSSAPISSAPPASSAAISSQTASNAKQLSVDWSKCEEDTKKSIVSKNYEFAKDFSAQVDEDKELITLTAVLSDATDPQKALDYADTMLRQFNLSANMQDSSIALGSKDSYGGLYDVYQVMIGIAPLSKVDKQSEWFVFDSIGKGVQTKHEIKLQKAYR